MKVIMRRIFAFGLCLCMLLGLGADFRASAEGSAVEFVTAGTESSALQQRAEELFRQIDLLPATGGHRNGRVRLSDFTQSADGSTDMKELEGEHYLIRYRNDVFYALDGSWTGTNGDLPMKVVGVTDSKNFYYISSDIDPTMAFSFRYHGKANGLPVYVLRFSNGRNLTIGSRYTGTDSNLYRVKADTTADLTKAPRIRFEHPDGAAWAGIRNATGTHGLRQSADMTCVRWKDNSAGDNDYDGDALYLYRVWNTEALGAQIHAMQSYLENRALYDKAVYADFLTCMEDSIALFQSYNPYPTKLIQAYDNIQEKLDQQLSKLKAYVSKLVPLANPTVAQSAQILRNEAELLPATGKNRNGRVRLSDFTQSADCSTDMKNLRGKHYLVRYRDGVFYALDGSWTGTDGNLPLKVVTPSDTSSFYYISSGISTSMAFSFYYRGKASNGMPTYVLRFDNGKNLAVGSQYTGSDTNLYYVKADTTSELTKAPKIRFEHPDGKAWVGIRNATGTHGLRQSSDMTCFRWKDNSAGDNDYEGTALYLYRLWSTKSLLTAIHEMKIYLDKPEWYDETVYKQFLSCMEESIALFQKYNAVPTGLIQAYDFIQETLDEKEAELRAFASRLNEGIREPSSASLEGKTVIHQLPLACGYVIRTRTGKIIVIDGGWEDNNTEGIYLFQYLQKITGDTTPHIDAWFITHAHADHHGCVPTFANLYGNQVTIDAFYYHYPTQAQINTYFTACDTEALWSATDWIPTWLLPKFKNAQGGATKGIICNTEHSGKCNSSFDFDDVHIEILLTFEDVVWAAENISGRYSGTSANEGRVFSDLTFRELLSDNFNETSLVFRATVGGQSILFTGDINYIGGTMLNRYHDVNASNPNRYFSLKSDYVQVSHHGHYGLPKNTYNKIDADIALWPVNYDEWNDNDYQNLIFTKQWFTDMGAKSYPAYQGPHTFSFPLVRSEAPITIPTELKDYVFDPAYYSAKYADVAMLYGNDEKGLYYHFVNYGIEEGRCASPFFDVRYYAYENGQYFIDTHKGDFVAVFQDFLQTYKTDNLKKLSVEFDAPVYAMRHKDLVAQGYTTNLSLMKHFAQNGYGKAVYASATFLYENGTYTYHDKCTVTGALAPTCTTAGKTGTAKCNTCGLVVKANATIPALGHEEVTDKGYAPTCTEAGLSDGKHCTVCNAVTQKQKAIPATGHTDTYEQTDEQSHKVTCSDCGREELTAHAYTDGTCICGAVESKEPMLDSTLKLSHSLNLASDISINFVVPASLLEGYDMSTVYVESTVENYEGETFLGTETVRIEPIQSGVLYYFTLTGITAVQMNDTISSVLYGEKDGQPHYSNADLYSVADYAYSQLGKPNSTATLKTLCADLLRYGAKAQIYKGYRVSALADEKMTEEYKACLSDLEAVAFGNNSADLGDLADAPITWAGKTLDLDSKVCLKFVFRTSNYTGDLADLYLKVTYKDIYGETMTALFTETVEYQASADLYAFSVDALLASELRQILSVQIFAGEIPVSSTFQYSPDTYGNNKTGTLLELCKALFAYSDSAKAYFSA